MGEYRQIGTILYRPDGTLLGSTLTLESSDAIDAELNQLLRDVLVLQKYVHNQQRANNALLLEQDGSDESGWEDARVAFDESIRELNNSGALTRWGGGEKQ